MRTKQFHSPQEKKALAYRKDHVVEAEYPHAFRRHWPRKKAWSHRAFRRHVHQLLDRAWEAPVGEDDARGDIQAEAVQRAQVRKDGVASLRERVTHIHERRIRTTAWNFFKQPYTRELHRSRFAAFLAAITASETPYHQEVAAFFGELLNGSLTGYWGQPLPPSAKHRAWLQAFLADEPEWEPRLYSCLTRVGRASNRASKLNASRTRFSDVGNQDQEL